MVAREWSEDMRELQINAVFPPREDFQVGDLYLPPAPPEEAEAIAKERGYLPLASWLGSVDLSRKMLGFYATRRAYPVTPTGQSGASPVPSLACTTENLPAINQASGEAVVETELDAAREELRTASSQNQVSSAVPPAGQLVVGRAAGTSSGDDNGPGAATTAAGPTNSLCNIFTSPQARRVDRMRLVAFPDFAKTTISEGDLSGLIPVEALTVAFGARSREARSVTFSVPVAESIGLPAAFAAAPIKNALESEAVCDAVPLSLPEGQREAYEKSGDVSVTAVTEVFYTRAIDVAVSFEETSGLGLELGLAQPLGDEPAADEPTEPTEPEEPAANAQIQETPLPEPQAEGAAVTQQAQQTQQTGQTQQTDPAAQTGAGTGDQEPDADDGPLTLAEAQRRIEALNQALEAAMDRNAPGGGLRVLSLSAGSIGMRRTFAHPIAIGYRGLTLSVKRTAENDAAVCTVVGGAVAAGPGPLGKEAEPPAE